MTEHEAIDMLKESKRQSEVILKNPTVFYDSKSMVGGCKTMEKNIKTYEIAIECISEIQQYRVLGSVQFIKDELSNYSYLIQSQRLNAESNIRELNEYRALGTVEELHEAMEKQSPMRVTDVHVDEYYCPACGAENGCDQGMIRDNFCPRCGHALDRSDIK